MVRPGTASISSCTWSLKRRVISSICSAEVPARNFTSNSGRADEAFSFSPLRIGSSRDFGSVGIRRTEVRNCCLSLLTWLINTIAKKSASTKVITTINLVRLMGKLLLASNQVAGSVLQQNGNGDCRGPARNVRPPRVTILQPVARAVSSSASVQPPSEPTRAAISERPEPYDDNASRSEVPPRSETASRAFVRCLRREQTIQKELAQRLLAQRHGQTAWPLRARFVASAPCVSAVRVVSQTYVRELRQRPGRCSQTPSSVVFCTTRSNLSPLSRATPRVSFSADSGRAGLLP